MCKSGFSVVVAIKNSNIFPIDKLELSMRVALSPIIDKLVNEKH